MKKFTWKLEVTIEVCESWVGDGFKATDERIKKVLDENILPHAYDDEFTVKVKTISAPDEKQIKEAQGF